jgi:SAM-dependent methyltransferase
VTGIDISECMLDRARRKSSAAPVEFLRMDAENLAFDDAAFDFVLCGFAIWFFPDIIRGVREMHRVLRPTGRLAFSTWAKQSHEPMMGMMQDRLTRYGVPRVPPPLEPWMACSEPEHLLTVLDKAGFGSRRVFSQVAGYYIKPDDWWTFLWGSAPRRRLSQLPPESLQSFREEVLADVSRLHDGRGIWFDVSALIGIGVRENASLNI